jgi:exodeoxyribonuclease VII small subunit
MTDTSSPLPADIAALSFEDALAQLEKLVRQLEDGKVPLDEAIAAYERGSALRRHCAAKLQEAQTRIERIVAAADGSLSLSSDQG